MLIAVEIILKDCCNFRLMFQDTLSGDDEVEWLVEFYTTWSPPCRDVMPAFAALSNDYANDYLRFGKLDVGKYPDAAMK